MPSLAPAPACSRPAPASVFLRRLRRAALGSLVCGVGAGAQSPTPAGGATSPDTAAMGAARGAPAAPALIPADGAAGATAVLAERAAAAPVAVGDRVRVAIWREPGLSGDYTVDERGQIVLPRLGAVPVAGRSIAAVRDSLVAGYTEYLRSPSITVTAYRRIGVQGEVRLPNVYYVDVTKTVREVLTEAGGPTLLARERKIALVRDGRRTPLRDWDSGGPIATELRSGDQIVVPRQSWWQINALGVVGAVSVVVPVALSLANYFRK